MVLPNRNPNLYPGRDVMNPVGIVVNSRWKQRLQPQRPAQNAFQIAVSPP